MVSVSQTVAWIEGVIYTIKSPIISSNKHPHGFCKRNHVAQYGSDVVACYGIAYKLSLFAVLLSVGLAQGIAPLFGFCYGAKQMDRLRRSVYIGVFFDILLGVFFAAAFALFGRTLTAFFLDDGKLIAQSASFLGVIGLSAPLIGVINIVTSYFQALGKAVNSMIITMLRNVVLFIPGVMLMDALWNLPGVIATQPVVEFPGLTILIF